MLGKSATQQLEILAAQFAQSVQDFNREVMQNSEAIFLHLPFWAAMDIEPMHLERANFGSSRDALRWRPTPNAAMLGAPEGTHGGEHR